MANLVLCKENLEKLGYAVTLCDTIDEAKNFFAGALREKTIGVGGSMSVNQMGLTDLLRENNQVEYHLEGGDVMKATRCQVYLSSVNGLAETGEMINIDGRGNRVSATIYGTEEVYFLVGQNKVEPTMEKALWRARNIAAPKNAQRLQRATPCAAKGDKCYDCNSPERICSSLVVHWRPSGGNKMHVVLVKEDLGY